MVSLLLTVLLGVPAAAAPAPARPAPTPAGARPPESSAPARKAADFIDVSLSWRRGILGLEGLVPGRYRRPTDPPRFLGRFEATLLDRGGREVDRRAFDFPLLADAEAPEDVTPEAKRLAEQVRAGASSATTVRLPVWPEAVTLRVRDRRSGRQVEAALAPAPKRAPPAPAKPQGR